MLGGEHRQICSALGKGRYIDSLVSESSVRLMRGRAGWSDEDWAWVDPHLDWV